MNVIDFIRETAVFLTLDRPDLYDMPTAIEALSTSIDVLREADSEFGFMMFSSYVLIRIEDDGVEEFFLTRKISSLIKEGEDCSAFSYTPQVNLPDIMDELD